MFDDIVIGSGLAAVGTVCGLPAGRRILVIAGPAAGLTTFYPNAPGIPVSHLGSGGLGRYWHGVIPTSLSGGSLDVPAPDFTELFSRFYPRTTLAGKIMDQWLFVPLRPIRPPSVWPRLRQERGDSLSIVMDLATDFEFGDNHVAVRTGNDLFRGRRLWVAAGVLHTPALLRSSLPAFDGIRSTLSDHAIIYLGQVDRAVHQEIEPPRVERSADGFWLRAASDPEGRGLFTLKPARFSYRKLDHGVEQRAAFGLPTGGVVSKLMRAGSMGLVAEALYNKFGLFPDAERLSVYAQVNIPDAFDFGPDARLGFRSDAFRSALDAARMASPWHHALVPSARPDLFVNGIHLYHSVDNSAAQQWGINTSTSLVKIVDASVVDNIGAEHHSFKLMAAAYARAKRS